VASASPGYIGPYRLLNVVHTGQASQIWQAYHDGERKIFGIKTLLQKYCRDREQVGYLKWEQAIGQKIVHDRIIQIYEYGADRTGPYLAMEWFAALNMKRRILHGLDQIGYQIPKIIDEAAEGLAYFNRLGLVHCDVKPDNFLVTDDGEVKLIDFALAKRGRSGLGRLFAMKSKVQGTRSYMAPEQIRGGALDARTDVYAFGCLLHELLSGKPPFTGASANELLVKHIKTPPPSLEAYNKNVTPEFAQLVRRALSKDPDKRPESVDEFRVNKVFKIVPRPPKEIVDTDK